jgi:hypothetical protein
VELFVDQSLDAYRRVSPSSFATTKDARASRF